MNGETSGTNRLAVLIDADNVEPDAVKAILTESIAGFGVAGIKRAYGDWTDPRLAKWKELLLEHAIQPMQQFANLKGKNATDSAMIIDAMDLLYTRRLGGFCIVSSDSDFTALARRIREDGLFVIGFGEAKTHSSLRAACTHFIVTERRNAAPAAAAGRAEPKHPAKPKPKKASGPAPTGPQAGRKPTAAPASDPVLTGAIREALAELGREDGGWVSLAQLGKALNGNADYKDRARNRGGLKKIIAASRGEFEIETRKGTDHVRDTRQGA